MAEKKLLNKINYPSDLRKLKIEDLKPLSKELREELINVVSTTGGHLGAGLGVIELTVSPPNPLPLISAAGLFVMPDLAIESLGVKLQAR